MGCHRAAWKRAVDGRMNRIDLLKRDLALVSTLLRRKPFNVLLQVTNRCNMRCSFCTFWSNPAHPRDELTLADFRRLESQLSELGRFVVSIEGGEPFNRPDILEIARIFSRRHITVLYTNGWYITRDNARALMDTGIGQVGVSIDFPDAARHDAKRDLPGTFERALHAIDLLRDAAPHGPRQVHIMSVLMEENQHDIEALLRLSEAHSVGHYLTLLATQGTRRDPEGGAWPTQPVAEDLLRLWRKYPHFRVFREYLQHMDRFLEEPQTMPQCRAGEQSFNIDHLGNVAPCIEKIGEPVGNVREESLTALVQRMRAMPSVSSCQDCWTYCRGMGQLMGQGGTLKSWLDFSTRMRSH